LKGYYFVTTIIKGNSISPELPGYCCQCGSFTAAISNCYQKFFNVGTRFSGIKVIVFEDQIILKELLTDISFQPLSILLDKISINIFKMGFSSNEEWHRAGDGYLSSFSYAYKRTNCNFIQKISNGLCYVEIWNKLNKVGSFVENTPTAVWQHIGILSKYTGDQLF
ncbi:15571_t:CDS:1, partial [Entrophospora sp. SA101]